MQDAAGGASHQSYPPVSDEAEDVLQYGVLVMHLTQQGWIFSTRPGDNSTCLLQNGHSGFPAGEDRNLPDSGTCQKR